MTIRSRHPSAGTHPLVEAAATVLAETQAQHLFTALPDEVHQAFREDARQIVAALLRHPVAEPYTAGRWRAAWWVLTGRAYALLWPKPGELEGALESKVVRRG